MTWVKTNGKIIIIKLLIHRLEYKVSVSADTDINVFYLLTNVYPNTLCERIYP